MQHSSGAPHQLSAAAPKWTANAATADAAASAGGGERGARGVDSARRRPDKAKAKQAGEPQPGRPQQGRQRGKGAAAGQRGPRAPNASSGGGGGRHESAGGAAATGTPPLGGEVGVAGRRGASANHLLNFSYEGGPAAGGSGDRSSRHKGKAAPRRAAPPKPFKKELFLQANFRFLVLQSSQTAVHATDADHAVDWEDVVQVETLLEEAAPMLQCPICLETPAVCPQMTRCGHMFCFPCILRLLLMGGGLRCTSPCPLCFAPVSLRDLRTVRPCTARAPAVHQLLRLRQMVRQRQRVVPVARRQGESCAASATHHADAFSIATATAIGAGAEGNGNSEILRCAAHSKLTYLADPTAAAEITMRQLTDLATQMAKEGGVENEQALPFVYHAMEALSQRLLAHLARAGSDNASSAPAATITAAAAAPPPSDASAAFLADVEALLEKVGFRAKEEPISPEAGAAASGGDTAEEAWPSLPPVPCPAPPPPAAPAGRAGSKPPADAEPAPAASVCMEDAATATQATGPAEAGAVADDNSFYCFYQDAAGQMFLLHPLNVRMLHAHYGSYDAMPIELEAPVLEMEEQIQTAETRRRYKFASHLPLTVRFQLCEVDLRGKLPAESLAPFAEELERRAKQRKRQAKKAKDTLAREAREAQAKEAVRWGPSASELKSMPSLQEHAALLEQARRARASQEESLEIFGVDDPALGGTEQSAGRANATAGSQPTVSFAHVTYLGFASGFNAPDATTGYAGASSFEASAPVPTWGSKGTWRSAAAAAAAAAAQPPAEASSSQGKKGRKGKQQVLFSVGGGR